MAMIELDRYNQRKFMDQDIWGPDLSENKFNNFKTTRPIRYYQIDNWEECRPDLISYNIYGKTDYWWILLKFNNIIDIFEELKGGFILKVPDRRDIQIFANKNSNRTDKK
jgi:hypothetical protein